jgi:hypothetical protein
MDVNDDKALPEFVKPDYVLSDNDRWGLLQKAFKNAWWLFKDRQAVNEAQDIITEIRNKKEA